MLAKLNMQITESHSMLTAMKETLRLIDPKYNDEEATFFAGIQNLRERLPIEQSLSLDEYLEEEERGMAECLLYLFWKGVKQNYDCFINPVSKMFLHIDYEDIHQESLMQHHFPSNYRDLGTKFVHSLPSNMKDLTEPITSYYAYLETVAYKLAHYYGFKFGDSFLPKIIPGYFPDGGITSTYCLILMKDLSLFNL